MLRKSGVEGLLKMEFAVLMGFSEEGDKLTFGKRSEKEMRK